MEESYVETKEISILDIIKVVINNIKLLIICIILVGAFAFVLSHFFISPKYISSISLYVNNNQNQNQTALNINDLAASQKLVNTYIVILKDDEVLNKVSDKLVEQYSEDELKKYIALDEQNGKKVIRAESLRSLLTMTAVDNTEVLKIQAKTKNAEFSAKICAIISEESPDILQRIVKAGSVEVIGKPLVPYEKSSPNVSLNTLIGLFVGLVIAITICVIKYMLDTTIKGEEDLKEMLNVPVLGEVPDFSCFKESR